MPLSWNDMQARATAFAHDWKDAKSEDADAKSFWDAFFNVFGVARRKVASFEQRVHKLGDTKGKIDLLWKGTLLVEHKSRGKDLGKAYQQALTYFPGLKPEELPRYVLVCDFHRFELHDLEPDDNTQPFHTFDLENLPKHLHHFAFIAGYSTHRLRETDPINQEAVLAVGNLHDALQRGNFSGHQVEVFLVRLLFCLFADDTGIFQPKDSFHDLIEYHTHVDGSDLAGVLHELFVTLNQRPELRQRRLADHFALFPYVNGQLFEGQPLQPHFDTALRKQLLDLCSLDWGAISPAIFGAMFQTVIELEASQRRRELGAHYTSEANILKVLGPLFLDDLRTELNHIGRDANKLFAFQKKLQTLTFLDPACGCGNFLVIAYRELRKLELEVLRTLQYHFRTPGLVFDAMKVDVDQFYGIEIEEFPAQIAQVAMWLTDHQMNVVAGMEFGEVMNRIPLVKSAHIRHGNALEIDWADFVPPRQLNYILGNPPFIGKQHQSPAQKAALESVTQGISGAGVLDFVSGWFIKAAQYISSTPDGFTGIAARANQGRKNFKDVRFGQAADGLFAQLGSAEVMDRRAVRCAFVATNSITQGEQVGVLWSWMLAQGIRIQFAHRTFQWSNEAPGKAAVHCVIIGFGMEQPRVKPRLFDYKDVNGQAHEVQVASINPYLVDAPQLVLPSRRKPICNVPAIVFGSMPNDGGHLLLTAQERKELLAQAPEVREWIRPFMGAEEFINGGKRWCLWFPQHPKDIARFKPVAERLKKVAEHRNQSVRTSTKKLAESAWKFGEVRQPKTSYLFIPSVSSEKRRYVPIGFLKPNVIASNAALIVPDATLYEFGILSSAMHNAWIRYTCGRLESRYRYSAGIVYNNFPWPEKVSAEKRQKVMDAAKAVLEARQQSVKMKLATTMADQYEPYLMPMDLLKAHHALNKAVDSAYGKRGFGLDEAARVAFLFGLYEKYTSLQG